jgi:hypothetical protein
LREAYDGSEFKSWTTEKQVSPNINEEVNEFKEYLTKDELKDYLKLFPEKKVRFFVKLTDEMLSIPIIENNNKYTYLDVITGQIRHIMYHVGHCNCILRSYAVPTVAWQAHNEKKL